MPKNENKENKYEIKQIIFMLVGVAAIIGVILSSVASDERSDIGVKTDVGTLIPSSEDVSSKRLNILIAGSDRMTGLTDAIMLLSVDSSNRSVSILQIPRDTYAIYSEGSYRKINGACDALGGMEELASFLSYALGVDIDRYVKLSPDALCDAVDALGGVEITLDEAMHYDDPYQGLSIHLPKGKQVLDGNKAEQFVRYRSGYIQGDIGRMDAQKIFLAALFDRAITSLSLSDSIKLAVSLMGDVQTDLTLPDIMELCGILFELDPDSVLLATAAGEAVTATVSGASYYVLSSEGMKMLLRELFGDDTAEFDPDRVFLNSSYESFEKVYGGYTQYEIFSASELGSGK